MPQEDWVTCPFAVCSLARGPRRRAGENGARLIHPRVLTSSFWCSHIVSCLPVWSSETPTAIALLPSSVPDSGLPRKREERTRHFGNQDGGPLFFKRRLQSWRGRSGASARCGGGGRPSLLLPAQSTWSASLLAEDPLSLPATDVPPPFANQGNVHEALLTCHPLSAVFGPWMRNTVLADPARRGREQLTGGRASGFGARRRWVQSHGSCQGHPGAHCSARASWGPPAAALTWMSTQSAWRKGQGVHLA